MLPREVRNTKLHYKLFERKILGHGAAFKEQPKKHLKLHKLLLLLNHLPLYKLLKNRGAMVCKENTFILDVLISAQKIKIVLLHSAEHCESLPPPGVLPQIVNLHNKYFLGPLHANTPYNKLATPAHHRQRQPQPMVRKLPTDLGNGDFGRNFVALSLQRCAKVTQLQV
jgi:hypothetical protein